MPGINNNGQTILAPTKNYQSWHQKLFPWTTQSCALGVFQIQKVTFMSCFGWLATWIRIRFKYPNLCPIAITPLVLPSSMQLTESGNTTNPQTSFHLARPRVGWVKIYIVKVLHFFTKLCDLLDLSKQKKLLDLGYIYPVGEQPYFLVEKVFLRNTLLHTTHCR